MIISLDFDGFLSALFLAYYSRWEVIGYYNDETLWVPNNFHLPEDLDKVVFVDADINRRNIKSIGHHVLKWSPETATPEHDGQGAQSLNPNLETGVTVQRFNEKYPFATIHFLVSIYYAMKKGIKPSKHPLFLPVLLHPDSTLKNAINYPQNCLNWIEALGGSDREDAPLYPICKILARTSFQKIYMAMKELYLKIEQLGFKEASQCEIKDPMDREEYGKMQKVIQLLAEVTGWQTMISFPSQGLRPLKGQRKNTKATKRELEKVLKLNPFSYAVFSKGYPKGLNYSLFEGL